MLEIRSSEGQEMHDQTQSDSSTLLELGKFLKEKIHKLVLFLFVQSEYYHKIIFSSR